MRLVCVSFSVPGLDAPPASASSSTTPIAATSSSTTTTSSRTPSTCRFLLFLRLWLWRVVDEQRIQRQGIGEDKVSTNQYGQYHPFLNAERAHRMLFPRIESESRDCGSRLRAVRRTVFRCVFICMSTPVVVTRVTLNQSVSPKRKNQIGFQTVPVMVPCTTEPFLSSIVTVSLFNFIRNL